MRQKWILYCVFAAAAFGQTGGIAGTVEDGSGAPVEGARVTAALWESAKPIPFVAGRPPSFLPVQAKGLTGAKGEFQVEGLYAGKYYLCVEKPEEAVLNPCQWADPRWGRR